MTYLSESSFEDYNHVNSYIQSDMELKEEQAQSPLQRHTVTSKCIGATHNSSAQQLLCVSNLMKRGELAHRTSL